MNRLLDPKNNKRHSTKIGVPYNGFIYKNPIFNFNYQYIINNKNKFKFLYAFDHIDDNYEKYNLIFSHYILENNIEFYYFRNINKKSSLINIGIPRNELKKCILNLIDYDVVYSENTTIFEKSIYILIFTMVYIFVLGLLCFLKDSLTFIFILTIIYLIGLIGVIKIEN